MRHFTVTLSAILIVATASTAFAVTHRHVAWEGLLLGKDGSKIRGPITMEAGMAEGTIQIAVNYKDDVAGAVRPWHVHVGSCEKGGPVFADAKAYTPLTVKSDGTAASKSTQKIALPESGSYYVNIHESASNMGKIVACGDLMLED